MLTVRQQSGRTQHDQAGRLGGIVGVRRPRTALHEVTNWPYQPGADKGERPDEAARDTEGCGPTVPGSCCAVG